MAKEETHELLWGHNFAFPLYLLQLTVINTQQAPNKCLLRKEMNDVALPLSTLRRLFKNIKVQYAVHEQLVDISN